MEFIELADQFAKRHGVADLTVEDGSFSLDIDGIEVAAVAIGDDVALAAEIGEPPVEGKGEFSDAMLEANMESTMFFAKSGQTGKYMLTRHLRLPALDCDALDQAMEAMVNTAEAWRRMLEDFRPAAKAAAAAAEAESPSFGASDFMQV